MRKFYTYLLPLTIILACAPADESADMLIINGQVATMNPDQPEATAVAIKDGRILTVGSNEEIEQYRGDSTTIVDASGQFVMPGFIESHGHFSGLGSSLQNLNFL